MTLHSRLAHRTAKPTKISLSRAFNLLSSVVQRTIALPNIPMESYDHTHLSKFSLLGSAIHGPLRDCLHLGTNAVLRLIAPPHLSLID
jgi:hypothetical protein